MSSRATAASTDILIANLYESVLEPAMLNVFLHEVAVRTESRAVHLTVFDDRTNTVLLDAAEGVVGTLPEEFGEIRRDYEEHHRHSDYRLQHLMTLPLGQWFQCHEVFTPQRQRRERFFRDFVLRWDYRYCTGMRMGQGEGLTTYLALFRRAEQGPHDAEDMRFLRQLTIHLLRASKLFYRTRTFRTYLAPGIESLQHLPTGVLILDQWQRVLFANAASEKLFQRDPGFVLNDGVLEVSLLPLRKRFHDEFKRVMTTGVPTAVLIKAPEDVRSAGLPCYLLRLPADQQSYQLRGDPAVLVLIPQTAPSAPEAVALLRTLYALSRREAELATALAEGETPQEFANRVGLEISTVRSQLKSVFLKTGTHRQSELVRLLSVLPRVTV